MKHILRICLVIVVVVGAWYGAAAIWGFHRIRADFYPLDQGVVANIVAGFVQAFIVALVLYVVWRPLRDSVNRWVHGHFERHRTLTASARSAELAELHDKVDRLIRHHGLDTDQEPLT